MCMMPAGAVWKLVAYLHSKATVDADDAVDNRSEEFPASNLHTNGSKHTPGSSWWPCKNDDICLLIPNP